MRIVDLSMPIISNMLANRDFAGNVYLNMVTHEDSKAFGSGAPDDPFTSAWNYIGMTEHTGPHVDAFFHMDPQGLSGGNARQGHADDRAVGSAEQGQTEGVSDGAGHGDSPFKD